VCHTAYQATARHRGATIIFLKVLKVERGAWRGEGWPRGRDLGGRGYRSTSSVPSRVTTTIPATSPSAAPPAGAPAVFGPVESRARPVRCLARAHGPFSGAWAHPAFPRPPAGRTGRAGGRPAPQHVATDLGNKTRCGARAGVAAAGSYPPRRAAETTHHRPRHRRRGTGRAAAPEIRGAENPTRRRCGLMEHQYSHVNGGVWHLGACTSNTRSQGLLSKGQPKAHQKPSPPTPTRPTIAGVGCCPTFIWMCTSVLDTSEPGGGHKSSAPRPRPAPNSLTR
jgi:hypothetical protein